MHIQIRISGPSACGKTFLLNKFTEFVKENYPRVAVDPIVEYEDVTGVPNEFLSIVVTQVEFIKIEEKFDVT